MATGDIELGLFQSGWTKDEKAVQDVIQSRREKGENVMCADYAASNNPSLIGYWESLKKQGVVAILLAESTKLLRKSYLRPFLQKQGTCVDRGTTWAVQTALDHAIVNRTIVSRPAIIQFGSTYVGARGDIGKNRLRGQGAILAEAMQCVSQIGVMEKRVVGKYDFLNLSEQKIEEIVVNLSFGKIPPEWVAAMRGNTCNTFWCESIARVFDCVAAGYSVPYACDYVTGLPDKISGVSRLGKYGPHCRCFTGVYVDDKGVDRLVSHESWGRFPAGTPNVADFTLAPDKFPYIVVKTAGGPMPLPPGEVGIDASQFAQSIYSGGEAWAVSAPVGFEPERLSDLMDDDKSPKIV